MSWLKTVFSAEDTISKTVDGVYNGVDKVFYTEEEKAEAAMRVLEVQLRFLEAGTGYNVARRIIAVTVTAVWSLWSLVFLVMCLIGFDTLALKEVYLGLVAGPFGVILSWYFASRAFGRSDGWTVSPKKEVN